MRQIRQLSPSMTAFGGAALPAFFVVVLADGSIVKRNTLTAVDPIPVLTQPVIAEMVNDGGPNGWKLTVLPPKGVRRSRWFVGPWRDALANLRSYMEEVNAVCR